MKTTLIIAAIYLSGVLASIIVLHKEVRNWYNPKSKLDCTVKVLGLLPLFYMQSWFAFFIINLHRYFKSQKKK